jgi:hypothetical protein
VGDGGVVVGDDEGDGGEVHGILIVR